MDARELRDRLAPFAFRGTEQWCLDASVGADTILRALDLLARTEESTDELVKSLCHRNQRWPDDLVKIAAATIVALKAELESAKRVCDPVYHDKIKEEVAALKAERDELKHDINCHIVLIDKLKAHAEAMANAISGPEHTRAVDAYRRDSPKDAP